jgi:hypothetical protein
MTRRTAARAALAALAALGLGGAAARAAAPPALDSDATAAAWPDTALFPIVTFDPETTFVADSLVFTIEAGSRLYPEWREEHRVRIGEPFPIGDTEFSAVVARFLPDFRLVDRRPVSASRRLANPAVLVVAQRDSSGADSTWAFLNFPPHFSPRSFFTFRLKEIVGYAEDPDSSGTEAPPAGAAAPARERAEEAPR